MPVSAWIVAGTAAPGLTSVDHSAVTPKPSTCSTAISVTRSSAGSLPVVSTSTIASAPSSPPCMDIRPVAATLAQRHSQKQHSFRAPRPRAPLRLHADAVGEAGRLAAAVSRRRGLLPAGRLARGQHPHVAVPDAEPGVRAGPERARLLRLAELAFRRPVRLPAHRGEPAHAVLHGSQGLSAGAGA